MNIFVCQANNNKTTKSVFPFLLLPPTLGQEKWNIHIILAGEDGETKAEREPTE